jgi:site-specific DNA recombinase
MSRNKPHPPAARTTLRCAIYTRKSTEEGLEKEFNSLDAQRESGEAFIKSQAHEGWECLATRYDDGGFTGGNLERPALKRLMADIEAGKVDCILVYKVDRLSRSLLYFARLMETFDQKRIAFVSVTQQFNTGSSMGRLVLNVLLSFAQFEREIISERTRDKIAAARRKGKWAGGHPILGYDIDPRGFKLVVNDDEAARVRAIFALYLEHQAMLPVVVELSERSWRTKQWTTRKGSERGGKTFTKTSLHKLLTNLAYVGKVRHKQEIHEGEHAGIVPPDVWQRVQALLQRNARTGGALVRNSFGAILKGLLRCVPCGAAMTPSHSTRKGAKRYRYYVCSSAQKRGWHTCPSKSIPAGEIERFVAERIRCIGRDADLCRATVAEAQRQGEERLAELDAERRGLQRDAARCDAEVGDIAKQGVAGSAAALARLANLQERLQAAEQRGRALEDEVATLQGQHINEYEVEQALAAFDPLWESMTQREQGRLVQLLVERVDYDGGRDRVAITFHPSGIRTLAQEHARQTQEKQP